jgi:sugar-specific transcriptional regulator TrmB
METALQRIGLTKNEVKIYLTILKAGPILAGEITNRSGIHRRNVYDSIERLKEKKLVGFVIKDNKKYFQINHPNKFLDLLEEKKSNIKNQEDVIKSLLPQLISLKNVSEVKNRITVFEGKKGLITILEDVIQTGQENCVLVTTKVPNYLQAYLKKFHKKRIKVKVFDKIILNNQELKRAQALNKMPHTESRVLSKTHDSPLALNIYDNKIGLLIFSEQPIGILIEDKQVASSFRKHFSSLWDMAETV